MMKRIFIFFIFLSLTHCSIFSPVRIEPENTYELQNKPQVVSDVASAKTLLVTQTDSSPAYNTSQIAYVNRPYQVSYYGKSRWVAAPNVMLADLITQTLQNTNYFRAVVSAPYSGHADYALNTQLIKLEHNFLTDPSTVDLVLDAQLVQLSSNRIIATTEFSVSEIAPQPNAYGGVIAANHATSRVLKELAIFTVQALMGNTNPHPAAKKHIPVRRTTTTHQ